MRRARAAVVVVVMVSFRFFPLLFLPLAWEGLELVVVCVKVSRGAEKVPIKLLGNWCCGLAYLDFGLIAHAKRVDRVFFGIVGESEDFQLLK